MIRSALRAAAAALLPGFLLGLLFGCMLGLASLAAAQSADTAAAPAQSPAPFLNEKKVALLVGISDYPPESGFPKLQFAAKDAQDLAAVLQHQGYYFNGNALGTIGPWGDYYPSITLGNAQLYGRAVFTNGTVLTFGPVNYNCVINGSTYTWTLNP